MQKSPSDEISKFRDYAKRKERGVDEWLSGIVRLTSDTKSRSLLEECVRAVNEDDVDKVLSGKKKADLLAILDRAKKRF
jgi:hypothetical protein